MTFDVAQGMVSAVPGVSGPLPSPASACFWSVQCTPDALDAATEAFQSSAISIAKTIRQLAPPKHVFSFPSLDDLFSEWGRLLFGSCAEAFFEGADTSADKMSKRLRNSIILLAEADGQNSSAVQLALCFSAIEALVCSSSQGITDHLSRRVATLLLPEPIERPAASKHVGSLYGSRSRTLHGDSVESSEDNAAQARSLAAAVVRAVVEWQAYQRRVGDDQTWPTFLKELEQAERAGKQFVGVPDDLQQYVKADRGE